MALYERAKRLEMLLPECKEKWVLRSGEFHTVLCALRNIGAAIEGSTMHGSHLVSMPTYNSTDIGGKTHETVTRCSHHDFTGIFFYLYMEAFLEEQSDLYDIIKEPLRQLTDACKKGIGADVSEKHNNFLQCIIKCNKGFLNLKNNISRTWCLLWPCATWIWFSPFLSSYEPLGLVFGSYICLHWKVYVNIFLLTIDWNRHKWYRYTSSKCIILKKLIPIFWKNLARDISL